MNILFMSELFHPHGSGAELATGLYAKILSNAGFNVVVVTNRFYGEPEVTKNRNLTVWRLPLFEKGGSAKFSILKRFDVLFSSSIRKLIKQSDIVYIPRYWFSAIPLARTYGKPVITHLHDYISVCPLSISYDLSRDSVCSRHNQLCSPRCIYVFERANRREYTEIIASTILNLTLKCYASSFLKLSEAIICVSRAQRNMITERMPYLSTKIEVIHNPWPETSYIDVEGDDFGYFGGPNYLKGFNTLCDALTHMRTRGTNGNRVPSIHATKFSNAKVKLDALGKLGFLLYGKLDDYKYEKLYKRIRAVIIPSIWIEPWGYVVIEALLKGRFVVASRTGGIPEQVARSKGVVLCEPGNYRELAEAIEFVNGLDREDIVNLGIQNREMFLKRFDNETPLRRFIGICDNLT